MYRPEIFTNLLFIYVGAIAYDFKVHSVYTPEVMNHRIQ